MLEKILVVNPDENYWLFRAGNGAEYFGVFYRLNKIGMAWDKLNTLAQLNSKENIEEQVKRYYPENNFPWTISSKIYKFVHEIKIGDIVVMPDIKKNQIAIGKIVGNIQINDEQNMTVDNGNSDGSISGFINKYRDIQWIKLVPGDELSPNILQYLNSPHTISALKNNSIYEINKILNDVFIMNEKIYIRYRVMTKKSVYAEDIALFYTLIGYVEDIISLLEDKKIKIETKINVSSPGDIIAIVAVSCIPLIVLGYIINGGEIEANIDKSKINFKMKNGKALSNWFLEKEGLKLEARKLDILDKLIEKMDTQINPEKMLEMFEKLELISPKELKLKEKSEKDL